ncbi:MAG TPA: UvrD-helicase domain-containing protein [Vicinamibacterales bacterium]
MNMLPADERDRRRIREDLSRSYVVEAAAGTGKTTELVRRIAGVLRAGLAGVDTIAAVTFTEKAAGELKLRLREELERSRLEASGVERDRLDRALRLLEEARVSTIHGFCADLLREHPVEAGIDPQFAVLNEAQADALFDAAFSGWIEAQLQSPGEGVRRSLRRPPRRSFGTDEDEDGPIERLRRAGLALREWRDHPSAWRRPVFDRAGAIERLVEELEAFAQLSSAPGSTRDELYVDTEGARLRWNAIATGLVARTDLDGLEGLLIDLRHDRGFARARKGRGAGYNRQRTRAEVWDARQRLYDALGDFETLANADLAALLREDLQECLQRYEALKRAEGALDFLDLLLRARALLRDVPAVRRALRRRITHLFVDEFQDTDPLQAEILILLAGEPDADEGPGLDWRDVRPRPGALFIVGDPKQSIYRFRRADVATYREVCSWLLERGAERAELSTSFRSVPGIQRLVNAAFEPVMNGDARTLRPRYVPLTPHREDDPTQPAVVALPVPEPYGVRNVTRTAIEKSLPDAVAAFIEWLVQSSGWHVLEPDRITGRLQRVPVAARHVCLLFRRLTSWGTDVTRPYVEALEAREIPHLLVGGKSFHAREEVETLRTALAAIEYPDDELSVFGTLRGALFAIGDDVLLEYRHAAGRLHPYRVPETVPERLQPVVDALHLLRTLHQRRNSRPVPDTIADLLSATRAHVGLALRRGGEQALANVLHVADLARRYEADGGLSFRGFVEALDEASERAEAPEAPILEEGSDGVRMMTVHKAKGLEFPVVVLADMTCSLARDTADRYIAGDLCAMRLAGWAPLDLIDHEPEEIERDQAEAERIAYVAATRARDLLVIPGVGDGPFDSGWLSPLNRAIYPAAGARADRLEAPGCQLRGRDTVLWRPDPDPLLHNPVTPGLHRIPSPDGGTHDVVWWDPAALRLHVEPESGIRHAELITRDAPRALVEQTLATYREWEMQRADTIVRGSAPSMLVRTAGEWARSDEPPPDGLTLPEVTVVSLARDDAQPSGRRFGTLLHAVLAATPLDGRQEAVDELAAVQGHLLGASADEIAAAAGIARAVLAHPVLIEAAGAAQAGACHREAPVTWRTADGTLFEGVVDLAFRTGGRWVVVDFKTDRAPDTALDVYRRQVGFYAAAIARATGEPCDAMLVLL